jgi:hypothetical protein
MDTAAGSLGASFGFLGTTEHAFGSGSGGSRSVLGSFCSGSCCFSQLVISAGRVHVGLLRFGLLDVDCALSFVACDLGSIDAFLGDPQSLLAAVERSLAPMLEFGFCGNDLLGVVLVMVEPLLSPIEVGL